jgi:predicted nucleotidyltransferase
MTRLPIDEKKIADFYHHWKINEFSFFGSVRREDFRPDSDVDILVSFHPKAEWSLWDLAEMKEELKKFLVVLLTLLRRRLCATRSVAIPL